MIQTLLLYFIASIILYLILNQLEKIIKENFYHYIMITQIYLLIVSGIFTTYKITESNHSIFLIVLFEFFIRIFISYYTETSLSSLSQKNLKKQCLALIFAYLLNVFFINKVETVFLTTSEFKILIWILIILYLYTNLKKYSKLIKEKSNFFQNKDGEYIVIQYAKLKNKYDHIISSKYKELFPLIYTIMIYENYNRPLLLRKLDIILYKIDKTKRKFGIMQIPSNSLISDEQSISIAIKKLERLYIKTTNKNEIFFILKKYYPKKNIDKLIIIYNKIIEFKK